MVTTRQLLEKRRSSGSVGRGYAVLLWAAGGLFFVVVAAIIWGIVSQSAQAWGHFGISFLWTTTWDQNTDQLGAAVFIIGTLTVTAIAMVIGIPIGLAAAAFLTEMCPRRIATPLGIAIDLIAAVPSIVVGLWGLYVLQPIFLRDVEPFMQKIPVVKLAFKGEPLGASLFLAGFVLSIMIVPTMVALTRTALAGVSSLLNPGGVLGSIIVLTFGESQQGSLYRSALMALAVILLVLTLIVNLGGRWIVRRNREFRLP